MAEGPTAPVRTCIGCRTVAPTSALVRVRRDVEGGLHLVANLPGRGAWLCRDELWGNPAPGCLEQAAHRQAFGRAFRAPVSVEAVELLRGIVQERARIERGVVTDGAPRRD